jgi:hypothetical protein
MKEVRKNYERIVKECERSMKEYERNMKEVSYERNVLGCVRSQESGVLVAIVREWIHLPNRLFLAAFADKDLVWRLHDGFPFYGVLFSSPKREGTKKR